MKLEELLGVLECERIIVYSRDAVLFDGWSDDLPIAFYCLKIISIWSYALSIVDACIKISVSEEVKTE